MKHLTANQLEWVPAPFIEQERIDTLIGSVRNLHPVVAKLLLQRGYSDYQTIKDFFNPDINSLPSFGKMKNLEKAADRLLKSILSKEKILIYGDYDVDGTCSVAMMVGFLRALNAHVAFYIPDRYTEGYGVSSQGIDEAIASKYDLLITVDCGIRAVEQLNRAGSEGIDVIICDHHLPGDELPNVFAILNPQQEDCNSLSKELCGCGVALMLIREVSELIEKPRLWMDYLYLAAIATCCDIVPLTGVNRIIVHHGLAQVNSKPSLGIKSLLNVARCNKNLSVSDVVFVIGPRINAAGRLDHASLGVHLLLSGDPVESMKLAQEIEKHNLNRRVLDQRASAEAYEQMIEVDPDLELPATVVHNPDWHKGIVGIVASRLIDKCYRPTVVFTEDEGLLTGSARSVEGFHIYEALAECSRFFEKFGGHAAAAGLSLKKENLADFTEAFQEVVAQNYLRRGKAARLMIDLEVPFSAWLPDERIMRKQLERCGPFGPQNMPPVFATEACLASSLRILKDEHLKFTVYQASDLDNKVEVIAFKMAEMYEPLFAGKPFKLAYTVGGNFWNGIDSVQLEAKAIFVD